MLNMTDTSKYKGFNVFTFYSGALDIKENQFSIFGFNFSIYNATDWNNEINNGNIWEISYKQCDLFHIGGCFENAAIWLVNKLPGMKDVYNFVNGIVHVFSNVSELFNNIGNLFAFDITFKIMLSSILVLAMVNGLLRYF
ncbi:spiroplasma phage ORF1-like family protein [Spiroplasma sp. K1]